MQIELRFSYCLFAYSYLHVGADVCWRQICYFIAVVLLFQEAEVWVFTLAFDFTVDDC